MYLKKINWRMILISTFLLFISTFCYCLTFDKLKYSYIVFSILFFPFIGLLLSFGKSKKDILYTQDEIKYYESLLNFKNKDLIFYNEQLHQFTENELEKFNCWIFDNKKEMYK